MNSTIQILVAFVGCIGAAFVFRIAKNWDFAFLGSVVGAIGWTIYLSTSHLNNPFFQSFISQCYTQFKDKHNYLWKLLLIRLESVYQ